MQDIITKYISLFKKYTLSFHTENEIDNDNIDFKINHSLRVLGIAQEFFFDYTKDINELDKLNIFLASLFHDIGRFEQYKQFKTYSDSISKDHGDLGVDVLIKQQFLSELVGQEYIIEAIKYHNKIFIPSTVDDKAKEICHYIRDFDKIDILKSITRAFETNCISDVLSLHLINEPEKVSYKLIQELFNENCFINYNNLIYKNDMLIAMLSWFKQFNHKLSLNKVFEAMIPERILTLLPDDVKNEIFKYIEDIRNDL